jgi:hypothetical protein
MSSNEDPDQDPKTAFAVVTDDRLKPELVLVEKYQAFSAELLRLALLGIAVLGFTIEHANGLQGCQSALRCVLSSIVCFGVSSCAAIAHRYASSETLRLFVWGLRSFEGTEAGEAARVHLQTRGRWVVVCVWLKSVAAALLALGAALLCAGYVVYLW